MLLGRYGGFWHIAAVPADTFCRAVGRRLFVIVDQRAIEDSRLSWAASGLLAYLLSRPDDWRVPVNELKKRGDFQA